MIYIVGKAASHQKLIRPHLTWFQRSSSALCLSSSALGESDDCLLLSRRRHPTHCFPAQEADSVVAIAEAWQAETSAQCSRNQKRCIPTLAALCMMTHTSWARCRSNREKNKAGEKDPRKSRAPSPPCLHRYHTRRQVTVQSVVCVPSVAFTTSEF
jgi:hypothetical protein